MKTYFRYILSGFIIAIIYLFYLIIKHYFDQFQIDNFFETIINKNQEIIATNEKKSQTERYIHTNAYISQMAKSMQNKQFPGEEVINIITQDDIDGNVEIDSREFISNINKKASDPTEKMENPDKWLYLWNNGFMRR